MEILLRMAVDDRTMDGDLWHRTNGIYCDQPAKILRLDPRSIPASLETRQVVLP